ncbi:hypothetical protein [Kribbella monticola]|uniref:hypothetical protein n=1 Tax=Kribbella monticola TaxID=2185285 RepID=UPI000DD3FB8C|nr:hypothetical protein [Kribbella monticola]
MRKLLRCLLGGSVALVLCTGTASTAGAVDLDRIPFRVPTVELLGASSAGVLYRVTGSDEWAGEQVTTWVKPAGAAAYQVPQSYNRMAGNRIFSYSSDRRYQVVGTPVDQVCDDFIPDPVAITAFGWISAEAERVELSSSGCRKTTQYAHEGQVVVADETGFVVQLSLDGDGGRRLIYHSYADAAHPRVIDDGGHNKYLGGLALRGTTLTWAALDYTGLTKSYVLRAKTDGSAPLVVSTVNALATSTAIAGATTGWGACYLNGGCSSGSIDADGTVHQLTGTHNVFSGGSRLYFDLPQGIVTAQAVDPTTARTRIADVALLPAFAKSVALGAGGVAYADDQLPKDSVNQRGYSRSGTTITVSAQTRIAQAERGGRIARDGRRTAYVDGAGDVWLSVDGGVKTKVFDAAVKVAIVDGNLQLSGTRMLWWKAKYRGEGCDMAACFPLYDPPVPMLYSAANGVSATVTGPVPYKPAALWANYLAYADNGNAIWRRDLSSNALVQVKAAGGPPVTNVAVHDDYVSWSTCVAGSQVYCDASTVAFRNMATRTAAVRITTQSTRQLVMSGGHVVYDEYVGNFPSTGTLKVLRLGTTATGVVGPIWGSARFAVHDETLGRVGPDGVAKITANSSFVAPPRYLGNRIATASFTPSAGAWRPEFPISKALTTCLLTIRSGTTVRRVLTCPTTVGSARPGWNGLDSAGHLVAKGTYSWTLTGSDSDGTLRWWTNATHPIAGTVRVT